MFFYYNTSYMYAQLYPCGRESTVHVDVDAVRFKGSKVLLQDPEGISR